MIGKIINCYIDICSSSLISLTCQIHSDKQKQQVVSNPFDRFSQHGRIGQRSDSPQTMLRGLFHQQRLARINSHPKLDASVSRLNSATQLAPCSRQAYSGGHLTGPPGAREGVLPRFARLLAISAGKIRFDVSTAVAADRRLSPAEENGPSTLWLAVPAA
ncbi:hypothetical protein LAD77_01150 [Klebsiella pneumoniae]|nr:hypothetical protein [Klebsiella pneumoniae]